jgi:hypothetical protein
MCFDQSCCCFALSEDDDFAVSNFIAYDCLKKTFILLTEFGTKGFW